MTDSNYFSITQAAASGALSSAATGLSDSGSVDFSTTIPHAQPAMEWQSDFYHDEINGVIHLLGKPANANSSWTHAYYTIATDSWTSPVNLGITSPGHIYGNSGMDYRNGDLYLVAASADNLLLRWQFSTKTWEVFTGLYSGNPSSELNSIQNGLTFHPGLYADGGVVVGQVIRTLYWNRATETGAYSTHTANTYGTKEGIGIYWPAQQAAYVGGSSGGGGVLLKVTADGSGNPVETLTSAAPIELQGRSRTTPGYGSLHVHPNNPNKLMILETAGGQRAWASSDGNNWTQVSNHPFDFEPRVVCSLRNSLGAFWAVGVVDSTSYSRLWRPAA